MTDFKRATCYTGNYSTIQPYRYSVIYEIWKELNSTKFLEIGISPTTNTHGYLINIHNIWNGECRYIPVLMQDFKTEFEFIEFIRTKFMSELALAVLES